MYKFNCSTKFILIANKSDKFGHNRDQIIESAKTFSDEINAFFISCSAKNTDNIDNLENIIEREAKRIIDEEEEKEKTKNTFGMENNIPNDKNNNNNFNKRQSFNLKKENNAVEDSQECTCIC